MICVYFVDRSKIDKILIHMSKLSRTFQNISLSNYNQVELLALERAAHITIETILDVGNTMIDGFIMRDPGSYEDIIDILEDEKVVNKEEALGLKEVIRLRKILIQEYTDVNHTLVLDCFTKNLEFIVRFPEAIRTYLENELGPVSAFIPNK
jgi:uncharacterized protein YutE (UPF0331/DUF86 family)